MSAFKGGKTPLRRGPGEKTCGAQVVRKITRGRPPGENPLWGEKTSPGGVKVRGNPKREDGSHTQGRGV